MDVPLASPLASPDRGFWVLRSSVMKPVVALLYTFQGRLLEKIKETISLLRHRNETVTASATHSDFYSYTDSSHHFLVDYKGTSYQTYNTIMLIHSYSISSSANSYIIYIPLRTNLCLLICQAIGSVKFEAVLYSCAHLFPWQ